MSNDWCIAWVSRDGKIKGRFMDNTMQLHEAAMRAGELNREHPDWVHYPALALKHHHIHYAAVRWPEYGTHLPVIAGYYCEN